jgi:hypothetical protein
MNRQVIPTYVHAMSDYLTSTTVPYAARRMGVSPATRRIVDGVAALTGVQSLLTDYEGGAAAVLPMRAHLAADTILGLGLISTAVLMRDAPACDRQLLAGLGAFALVNAVMTQPDRGYAREYGDVLDESRFSQPSPAHAGFTG